MNERREAILAIARPTPPAPKTRAFIKTNSKRVFFYLLEPSPAH